MLTPARQCEVWVTLMETGSLAYNGVYEVVARHVDYQGNKEEVEVQQPSAAWVGLVNGISSEEREHLGVVFRDVLEAQAQEAGDAAGTLEGIGMLDDCDSLQEKAEQEVAAFRAEVEEDKVYKNLIVRNNGKRKRDTGGSLRLIETNGKKVKSKAHVRRGCKVKTVELSESQKWVRDQLDGETTMYAGHIMAPGYTFVTDIVQAHKDSEGNVVRIDLREVKPAIKHSHLKAAAGALWFICCELKRNPPPDVDVKLFLDVPRPIHPDIVKDFEDMGVTVKVWPGMPSTSSSYESDA